MSRWAQRAVFWLRRLRCSSSIAAMRFCMRSSDSRSRTSSLSPASVCFGMLVRSMPGVITPVWLKSPMVPFGGSASVAATAATCGAASVGVRPIVAAWVPWRRDHNSMSVCCIFAISLSCFPPDAAPASSRSFFFCAATSSSIVAGPATSSLAPAACILRRSSAERRLMSTSRSARPRLKFGCLNTAVVGSDGLLRKPYMFSCRTKDCMFECLKCRGRILAANSCTL
mmetsp:Transcript_16526/g.50637  ORF Transcript_16526/g.50637 Transcript_16526/m.50637 type:complete len:227 (+) Transcript_16526:1024-1704(+)